MKIWHISDTHAQHRRLIIPEGIGLVIFSGDATNYRETEYNYHEMIDFLEWYRNLEIPNKVFVAGNHDTSIEKGKVTPGDISSMGIIYLENYSTIINGLKIWGSPITPSFGHGWAFNRDRGKTANYWNLIDADTDIVITHGPPMGILDYSRNREGGIDQCGCKSLLNTMYKIKPKLMCFGHIHNSEYFTNAGYFVDPNMRTIFSNGSCVTDRKFNMGPTSNGNIFEL